MSVTFKEVSKKYGAITVLHPTELEVADGEFLTILGPSGSGKTTILRLVGGFIRPSGGRVMFEGNDITDVPTHKRPFNTVFQDYALFPHMTVADNVSYGLRVRGVSRGEARRQAALTLEIVGLNEMLDRMPSQLSGGQRQRVALARAIVCEPKLVLLDEPLSSLDAELRRQMQGFLKGLQRRLATTFIFVTHDQEEAITMSDRIVVMNQGRIEQIGSPKEIYYSQQTPFVARFFGDNNLVEGQIVDGRLESAFGQFALPVGVERRSRPVLVALRPEKLMPVVPDGGVALPCTICDVVFAGAVTHLYVHPDAAPDQTWSAKLASSHLTFSLQEGEKMKLGFAQADLSIIEVAV
jgi:spermidine/putrescine transport system ATP-binding protein